MKLIDAPIGLFMFEETLCVKTEYANLQCGVEAYIVSSGEIFWGGAKTKEERHNLEVTPVSLDDLRPHGRWICMEPEIGYFACSECDHRILRAKCNYCPNCGAKMDKEESDTK